MVELEERLLQARSRELRAAAEAQRERDAADKAGGVASSAQAERAGLKEALRALQVAYMLGCRVTGSTSDPKCKHGPEKPSMSPTGAPLAQTPFDPFGIYRPVTDHMMCMYSKVPPDTERASGRGEQQT